MTNKAYHISFVFDQRQPGVITIPGKDPEDAISNLMKLMESFNNVEVMNVIDLAEIPFLQHIHDAQNAVMEDGDEETAGDNVIKFEPKPN
jgi:hypothetical protein